MEMFAADDSTQVARGNADVQLQVLDEKISAIGHQSFVSAMDGNTSQTLHLGLRLSVCEGVRHMYRQATVKKTQQVPGRASHSVALALPNVSSSSMDKIAGTWSSAFCEFYRDS